MPLYRSLPPRDKVAQEYGFQAVRSSASVGARYREACRARSDAEFVSKMNGGLQELDETAYWFELLIESGRTTRFANLRDILLRVLRG